MAETLTYHPNPQINPGDYFDLKQTLSPWQIELLLKLLQEPERLKHSLELELEQR